jgi:FkbM family methyltransferase
MSLLNRIKKKIIWLTHVRFDADTGFYRYRRFGKYIYIRHPEHFLEEKYNKWNCEELFFHFYMPKDKDLVVDLGAGYGEEAIYIASRSPDVSYIGVEAQPVIYECLSNTFRHAGKNYTASPFVISDSESVKFVSQFSYRSVGEVGQGYIDVPTITWDQFLKRYKIQTIDLLKMNIEGAEKDILKLITDFSVVKRFIISCHDFRANNNEGDWFRTKEFVISVLKDHGYTIKMFHHGIDWADDWIYADK